MMSYLQNKMEIQYLADSTIRLSSSSAISCDNSKSFNETQGLCGAISALITQTFVQNPLRNP